MDRIVYALALSLVKLLQTLPLPTVAWLGRLAGGLAYWLDKRHRQVALDNLQAAFAPPQCPGEIQALAREHFRRLGENYCAAIKTASMSAEQLAPHLELVGMERVQQAGPPSASRVVAIGHFGNFELYARANRVLPEFRLATTYRALRQPSLNRLLARLRMQSGCLLFERRKEARALQAALTRQPLALGLLSDQHAGQGGVWGPFLGRICSTTRAPALYAQRYKLPLLVAICFRTKLAHWRIEITREIPTFKEGRRRLVSDIMQDVNEAFAEAVLRDPANWFWVHNRWRTRKKSPLKPPSATVPERSPVRRKEEGTP